jgi:Zn-dependent protease
MSQNFDLIGTAFRAMKYFVPFLFALCFHEFAHGWVARLRGDNTAETMGRLTLNPLAHADLIGTVILPLMAIVTGIPFFGWAKPVPVDERNLKNPKVDMFWIAFAGPLSNLLLALIGAIGLGLFVRYGAGFLLGGEGSGAMEIVSVFKIFITVNVFLAVFNMLPVYPLDGAKVLARFLPDRMNVQLEAWSGYTSILLLFVFMSGGLSVISGPAIWVSNIFLSLAQGVVGA